jgi:hypothetical protein
MLGPFYSGGRFRSGLESVLRREPLMKTTLVAFDLFAMPAEQPFTVGRGCPMFPFIECSAQAVF